MNSSSTAAKQQSIPPAVPSRIGVSKRGRLSSPLRFLIYGIEGAGKSTLFADSPSPIWLDIEDGTGRLDVTRYQFRDTKDGHVPQTYGEILAAIEDLARNPHDHQTLVIDTADRLEALLWKYIIDRDNPASGGGLTGIESYGYGKGFNVALDEWRALCGRLDRLRIDRGMAIAILGHSVIRTFRNPEANDFDRYQLAIHEKAGGFLKGWSDVVGFLRYEEGVKKAAGQERRAKGWSTDQRVLCLARTAAYDAKGRGGMPSELDIPSAEPWSAMAKALAEAANINPADLVAAIAAEVERIADPELKPRVDGAVAEAIKKGDTDALHRFVNDLRRRPARQAA